MAVFFSANEQDARGANDLSLHSVVLQELSSPICIDYKPLMSTDMVSEVCIPRFRVINFTNDIHAVVPAGSGCFCFWKTMHRTEFWSAWMTIIRIDRTPRTTERFSTKYRKLSIQRTFPSVNKANLCPRIGWVLRYSVQTDRPTDVDMRLSVSVSTTRLRSTEIKSDIFEKRLQCILTCQRYWSQTQRELWLNVLMFP